MSYGDELVKLIDDAVERSEEDEFRNHLGASVIGKKCLREIYYHFRWAEREPFPGRMLRLFARGQREEDVFVDLLRLVGAKVYTKDPSTGKQIRVVGVGGHFGGSLDGVATHLPGLPHDLPLETPVLLEMKTHKEKLFNLLKKGGLKNAHPKHFKQAQVYMRGMNLQWCLYCAVNKNDDELWFEFFPVENEVSDYLLNRAETVVFGEGLPARISENPSWYECKFCPMLGVCFGYTPPRQNCRTCVHSRPLRDGTWQCGLSQPEIQSAPLVGCRHYEVIPHMSPRK